MGIYALLVSFVFSLFIGYGGISASAAVVASSSDASDASDSFLEELKPENPGAGTLSAVRENADSVSPLSLDSTDWVNVVLYDVSISGTQYLLAFPSDYEGNLLVDSDGLLWNVSGNTITGRLFQSEFDPAADEGYLLYMNPCLGNNFTSNHEYGSPNYVRHYYWENSSWDERLTYDQNYVTVQVDDIHHLYHTDELLDYVVIVLIGCCLICLWKRSAR